MKLSENIQINIPASTVHLTGWGRFRKGRATVLQPELPSHLQAIIRRRDSRKLLAFGQRRSYGDACLNTGQMAVSFARLDRAALFDHERGWFTCEGGMTIDEIIRVVLPHGWFLPVTPGTGHPTVGGCLAANVHGKNHHAAGSFSRYVRWIELVTGDTRIVRCSKRNRNSDLFMATAGGMGLTGFIYLISLKLMRVPSAYIAAEHVRVRNLKEMMETLEASDVDWHYSVAWLDCLAKGDELGRGEIILGRHARHDELPGRSRGDPYKVQQRREASFPFAPPISMVNFLTSRLFNEFYYRKGGSLPRHREIVPYDVYFYPLDRMQNWNLIYGKRGFVQYQFVVPFEAGASVIRRTLELCLERGFPSSLAVLKRFGEEAGLLSFPMPGWTLALDFGVRKGLLPLLDELDRIIIDHGGRVYLAKDARLKPGAFRDMYPEFEQWLEIKKRVDPENVFSSDLARRLKIVEEAG